MLIAGVKSLLYPADDSPGLACLPCCTQSWRWPSPRVRPLKGFKIEWTCDPKVRKYMIDYFDDATNTFYTSLSTKLGCVCTTCGVRSVHLTTRMEGGIQIHANAQQLKACGISTTPPCASKPG